LLVKIVVVNAVLKKRVYAAKGGLQGFLGLEGKIQ
jgi:hypothetical protein